MGDGAAERALLLRALGVDVDPLEVTGGFGELVHALLGDLHPGAVAQVLAHEGLQFGAAVDDAC